MKTLRIAGLIVVTLLGGLVLIGGWLARRPSGERKPPASVPRNAAWVGFEKGEWVHCVPVHGEPDLFAGSVYDLPGNKLTAGDYTRVGERRTQLPKPVGYDLTVIEIEGGKLIPVGRHSEIGNCHRIFPDNAGDFREERDYPLVCDKSP